MGNEYNNLIVHLYSALKCKYAKICRFEMHCTRNTTNFPSFMHFHLFLDCCYL